MLFTAKNKKYFTYILASFLFLLATFAFADKQKLSSWTSIVEQMEIHLNKAYDLFVRGDGRGAYDEINTAYFRFYESKGMEKITMGYISGARKVEVENTLYAYRKFVKDANSDKAEVKAHKDKLIAMLYEDAAILDGTSKGNSTSSAVATFLSSFLLILREGMEAILVIAAIIAYLVKTGKKKYIFSVYIGALAGIVLSIILAILFGMLSGSTAGGMAQEIFEGVGMFLAVIVLFYVSNWMISKAESQAWDKYVKSKVEASVTAGNKFALVFASFIAVAREGAELILFFQGVPIKSSADHRAMIYAIIASTAILILVFLAIRFLSVKLPLKPFFIATSVLMYIMCFSFAGKGVKEFQEGLVMSNTKIPWSSFELDILGIYPTYESFIAQMLVILATVISIFWYAKKNKKVLAEVKKAEAVSADSNSSEN